MKLVYLDTGEIFEADDDGFPTEILVATMQAGVLDDDVHGLGQMFAAAPVLLDALSRARGIINACYVGMGVSDEGRDANLAFVDAALTRGTAS